MHNERCLSSASSHLFEDNSDKRMLAGPMRFGRDMGGALWIIHIQPTMKPSFLNPKGLCSAAIQMHIMFDA